MTLLLYFHANIYRKHDHTSSCISKVTVIKTTYNRNIVAPNNFVIFHLLRAIVATTDNNIIKSKMVEQNKPSLFTLTAAAPFIRLWINHGNGNLRKKFYLDIISFLSSIRRSDVNLTSHSPLI